MRQLFYALYLATALAVLLGVLACDATTKSNGASSSQIDGDISFNLLSPEQTGINHIDRIVEDASRNYFLFNYMYVGGAIAIADFDQDGLEDVYVVNNADSNYLYYNRGEFRFERAGRQAGVAIPSLFKTGVTIVDINQDGLPDIYQCVTGEATEDLRNRLLVNQGDGTFSEQAELYGLALANPSTSAVFFDFDLDGDLDVFVGSRPIDYRSNQKVNLVIIDGKRTRSTKVENPFESDVLLRNDNGKYVDVTKSAGVLDRAFTLSVNMMYANADAYPDLYVSNDYVEPDILWINNRDGTFTRATEEYLRHQSHSSMGVDVADLDNDGDDDFMVVDMMSDTHERQIRNATPMRFNRYQSLINYGYDEQIMRNMLQVNNGNNTFSEVACLADVYKTEWSWGPLFFDSDNDGYQDLFISNGFRREVSDLDFTNFTLDSLLGDGPTAQKLQKAIALMPTQKVRNYLFANHGQFNFSDVTQAAGLAEPTFSNGAAYSDLNQDGKLDLVVHNFEDPVYVYENSSSGSSGSLSVRLTGLVPNRDATGSRVTVYAGGSQFHRTLQPTRGFFSSQTSRLHFGLGEHLKVDSIKVQWADGTSQITSEVANENVVHIAQKPDNEQFTSPSLQVANVTELPIHHVENSFAHFQQDPLLYRTLDAEGPISCIADINGDGIDDAYLGASKGSVGLLMLSSIDGYTYDSTAFLQDQRFEDGCATFFDADSDGDQDLFIGSSGVVELASKSSLQNRLYLNTGNGAFELLVSALPATMLHSAAVVAVDIDGDSDLDLVVGNHADANNYPDVDQNEIYLNNKGKFSLGNPSVLPGWENFGMVNDMSVLDSENAETATIVAVGEWTRPGLWIQSKPDKWINHSEKIDKGKWQGLWFSVTPGDFDNDGDTDLILGGLGLNTRFSASLSEPLRLPVLDYDNNGKLDPVIYGTKGEGRYLPYIRREELARQVPAFAKAYTRYAAFARSDMDDIVGPRKPLTTLQASQLASQVCYLQENLNYICQDLPREAQWSALLSGVALSRPETGQTQFFGAGNLSGLEIHGGPLDASFGVHLVNDSGTELRPLKVQHSSLKASGEVRSLQLMRTKSGPAILVGRNDANWELLHLPDDSVK